MQDMTKSHSETNSSAPCATPGRHSRKKGSLRSRHGKGSDSNACSTMPVAVDPGILDQAHYSDSDDEKNAWSSILHGRFAAAVGWIGQARSPSPPYINVRASEDEASHQRFDKAENIIDAASEMAGHLRGRLHTFGAEGGHDSQHKSVGSRNRVFDTEKISKPSAITLPKLPAFTPSSQSVHFELCLHNGAQGLGIYFVPREIQEGVTEAKDSIENGLLGEDKETSSLQCHGCDQCAEGWFAKERAIATELGAEIDRDQPFVRR